jgi:septal ring factor EnvC (AmiA/AmiB activator)
MPLGAAELDQQETQQQLKQLTNRLNELKVWMTQAEKKRTRWLQEIADNDREVAQLSRDVASVNASLETIEASQQTLGLERDKLEHERVEQARRITEHLSAAYRLNGQDYLKLVLNQESPETIERMMRYHRYFSRARIATLSSYQQTLNRLAENAEELEAQYAAQAEQQQALKVKQVALQSSRNQRQALLADLTKEVESAEQERSRLLANQQRLKELLVELQRRSKELDGSQFVARKGKMPWPIKAPVRHTYGHPRSEGRLIWHGLLFNAKTGTPVKAVARGKVVYSDWLRGYGLLTVIDHGDGYMTLYGQTDDLTKNVGDWVEPGETVAHAGNSGGKADSGLYFQVSVRGEPKDPINWLARRR